MKIYLNTTLFWAKFSLIYTTNFPLPKSTERARHKAIIGLIHFPSTQYGRRDESDSTVYCSELNKNQNLVEDEKHWYVSETWAHIRESIQSSIFARRTKRFQNDFKFLFLPEFRYIAGCGYINIGLILHFLKNYNLMEMLRKTKAII